MKWPAWLAEKLTFEDRLKGGWPWGWSAQSTLGGAIQHTACDDRIFCTWRPPVMWAWQATDIALVHLKNSVLKLNSFKSI